VLAVQIPRFVGGGQKVLVPTVLGQTKRKTPPIGPSPDWETVWEEKLTRLNNRDAIAPCQQILEWAKKTPGISIRWSGGPVQGGFKIVAQHDPTDIPVMFVEIGGPKDKPGEGVRGYFQFGQLTRVFPFTNKSTAREAVE